MSSYRKLALLEPLLLFGLIVAYIWELRFIHPMSWIAIPAMMILSHWLHHESPRALGFQLHNLAGTLRELGPLLILTVLLLLSGGLLLRTVRQIDSTDALLALAGYLPWGLSQQYALNGYFLNRFEAAVSHRVASLLTALFFCAAHAPNPFLLAITLPLGWYSTLVYRRTHNLYFLGIAHAAIGLLLLLVVPDSISHHLRVGPGWFRP
jgi:membrane protease YdiL (CAAX protease family)